MLIIFPNKLGYNPYGFITLYFLSIPLSFVQECLVSIAFNFDDSYQNWF